MEVCSDEDNKVKRRVNIPVSWCGESLWTFIKHFGVMLALNGIYTQLLFYIIIQL